MTEVKGSVEILEKREKRIREIGRKEHQQGERE